MCNVIHSIIGIPQIVKNIGIRSTFFYQFLILTDSLLIVLVYIRTVGISFSDSHSRHYVKIK